MKKPIPGFGKCLEGKIAVVTGAARGIGRATAVAFAREGVSIVGPEFAKIAHVSPKSSKLISQVLQNIQSS